MRTAFLPLVVLLVAVPVHASRHAPLPRSAAEAQGVSSRAILRFIEEAEQKIDALHSFMMVRHGHVVAEGWWAPYAAGEPHMMFSLSKSFTSTAVGLAVAEGKLSVDDLVLSLFPDEAPAAPGENLKAMRVRDLLTMTAGHHQEDLRDFPYGSEESVVKKFLALPVAHKPGTFFVYNTPASYMLSAIVQKVTGQTVLDYLRPRLFEPLGIDDPTWEASKQGVSMGGFGLSVRTEDIAKFGELYLRKGTWRGRQLIPASWVETATARHVSNGSAPSSDWEQGYGFQFWRSRHGFYRGDGAHGQFCLVLPQYDTVIAITSGTRDMGSVMNLVWEHLVPALNAEALPADAAAERALAARLTGLTLKPQAGASDSPTARGVTGTRYVFGDNAHKFESITLESVGPSGEATFTLRMGDADQRVTAAPGAWRKATFRLEGKPDPVAASGAWTADDTYTFVIARYRTPFVTTCALTFAEERLAMDCEQNVGAPAGRAMKLVGRPEPAPTGSRE